MRRCTQYKIGRFIAEQRKQKNMTQEALGEKAGVTNMQEIWY
ncbi:MAG: helix-turn-helix transcriptional regulator [Erysipelotrichaceae bacterium]|nr:helix-turn-helix transcriptional regulator [Erysipelotrichaceae bacterium]